MSPETDAPSSRPGSAVVPSVEDQMNTVEVPSTPPAVPADIIPASQETLPSTEGPGSPMDQDDSYPTEPNDDVDVSDLPRVIPSSQTPPPSSQVQQHQLQLQQKMEQQQKEQQFSSSQLQLPPSRATTSYVNSQRSAILSPPVTGRVAAARRELVTSQSEFTPPTPSQIADATSEELRTMLQASIAEQTRLKAETAHHKLQYNLLSMQADEDAKRAAVENEMTMREVEALRLAESARQARRELGMATEISQAKYQQLKTWYDDLADDNEVLQKRVKLAKRVIQQKEEEITGLVEEKELLLNRLRENREHFHLLTSPGGMFHGAMTPKQQTSPSHARSMSYQTPKTSRGRVGRDNRTLLDRDQGTEPIAALLQALSQENNSAPSTPVTGHRPPPRHVGKHVRNVQSMSSLPTTPTSRPRGEYSGLLPSVDLVPQTEPPPLRFHGPVATASFSSSHGISGRYLPETPTRVRHPLPGHPAQERGRKSRESTISADEDNAENNANNEQIARQALQSVAARAASQVSFSASMRNPTAVSSSSQRSHTASDRPDEEVFESQASQAASAMLRRDPRESFEVANSVGNSPRDGTPAPAEKSAKLQAKLFGGLSKGRMVASSSPDKRKFSGGNSTSGGGGAAGMGMDTEMSGGGSDLQSSPTKKVRVVPSLRDNDDRHHYQQQQRQHQHQQQQQAQQRVGLGIQYN